MDSLINSISYNIDNYVVMANEIIKGKQDMTLQEAKFIRFLVTQIIKQDKDLKTYNVNIRDLANFLDINISNMYSNIRNLCNKLLTRTVSIWTGNAKQPWKTFQWLNSASYDGKGTITIRISDDLKPYLLSLNAWFTKYKLGNMLYMDSFYAIRFYELIKMKMGIDSKHNSKNIFNFEFTVKYLKEYFCCEKKFERISNFKSKVIDICLKEINEKTDLSIVVEYIKTGRAITSIQFFVQEKEVIEHIEEVKPITNNEAITEVVPDTKEQPIIKAQPVEVDIDDLADSLRDFIKEPLKIKELKEILAISNNNLELIMHKYAIYQLHDDIEDLKKWLIWAIETDYQEPLKDIDDLCDELRAIISEPLSTKDLKALLSASNNNIKLIKDKYQVAKKQGKINNLTAFLIAAIKNDFNTPVSIKGDPVIKKNSFINYEQHDWDFEELARKDEEFLIKNLERD